MHQVQPDMECCSNWLRKNIRNGSGLHQVILKNLNSGQNLRFIIHYHIKVCEINLNFNPVINLTGFFIHLKTSFQVIIQEIQCPALILNYRPRNKIANPLTKTVAPAMACVYLSSFPNLTILRPYDARTTRVSMVKMVITENTSET